MSAIRSALDELAAVDVESLSVDEMAADVVELSHVAQMVEVLRARRVKSLTDRDSHHRHRTRT